MSALFSAASHTADERSRAIQTHGVVRQEPYQRGVRYPAAHLKY